MSGFHVRRVMLGLILATYSGGAWAQLNIAGGGLGGGEFGDDFGGEQDPQAGIVQDLTRELHQLRQPHATGREPAAGPRQEHTEGDTSIPLTPEEDILAAKLSQVVTVDLLDTPLVDVVDWLRHELSYDNVVLDSAALSDEGIDPESDTLTFSAKKMTAGAALHHMLAALQLTTTVQHGALTVTTDEVAEETLRTRVYPVWDLVRPLHDAPGTDADYDTVIELITSSVAPNSWDEVGGPANIDVLKGLLTISQTESAHGEIGQLLTALRSIPALDQQMLDQLKVVPASSHRRHDRARAFLDTRMDMHFTDSVLTDVLDSLREDAPVNLLIDHAGLEDEGIDPRSTTVTIALSNVRLSSGLQLMLTDLKLTYIVSHEAIVITSEERAEETLQTHVIACTALMDVTDPSAASAHEELDALRSLIMQTIAPSSWDAVGGPAWMGVDAPRGALVISQTARNQRKIEALLQALLRGRRGKHAAPRREANRGDDLIVKAYQLSEAYGWDAGQGRLISLLQQLLRDSDNAVNEPSTPFRVEAAPGRLVVTHRRDAQVLLQRVLEKLGALATSGG